MPTVSVILPTYNAAPYVQEAVESVLTQTFNDFELLVIDDGSTDGTVDTVRGFNDERIELIHRDGSGITGALNHGITEASGTYIARQDGDDRSAPERFEMQVEFLERNPDVGLVGTATDIIDESGRVVDRRHVLEHPSVDDLLEHNHYVHGSVMMRRNAVEAVGGYDETFEYTEDYDLWLRIADEYAVRNIDEFLYALRLRSDSIYGSELFEVKLWELFAKKRFTEDIDDELRARIDSRGDVTPLYESLSHSEQTNLHREVGKELLRYHESESAREHLSEAFSRDRSISTAGLYALSYCPPAIENVVERAYRRMLNRSLRKRNQS